MKKLLYSAAALALALFAGSCQQENLEPEVSAGSVTYTVQVPGSVATKADYSDDFVLTYEVYRDGDLDNMDADPIYEGTKEFLNGKAELSLQFVKDQMFTVLFWAQKEDAYDLSDLRAVSLKANANAEVFAGKDHVVSCASESDGNVSLVRPVGQINIATLTSGLVLGETTTVTPTHSEVTVAGLYTTYNVATKEVSGTNSVAFDKAAVPATAFDGYADYTPVSTTCVGFMPTEGATVDVDFKLYTEKDGEISHSVPQVPVKANVRTYIIGNLVSATDDYTIILDGKWEDETYEILLVKDASGLQAAINDAEDGKETEIKLEGDIDLNDLASLLGTLSTKAGSDPVSLTVPAGKTITLDLNGYNLTGVDETDKAFALIFNNGNLSIVNTSEDKVSKITVKATVESGWNRCSAVVSTESGSTLTVGAGVEIEHLGGTSMSYGIDILTNGKETSAVAVIDGATVKSAYRAIRQFLNGVEANNSLTVKAGSVIESTTDNKSIWMQDPSKNANSGSLVVEAGAKLMTDAYLDVTEGSVEWPVNVSIAASALQGEAKVVSENVPAGYEVKLVDGVWTVVFTPVVKIGEKGYPTLQAAVDAAQNGDIITFIDDIEQVDGVLITDKNITIDLNAKTYTVSEGASTNNRNIKVNGTSVVTIKNGTMVAGGDYSSGAYGTLRTEGTANVVLTGVKLYNYRGNGLNVKALSGTVVKIENAEVYSQYGGGIEAAGGTVELSDVTVEQKGMYTAPYNSMAISVNGGGKATVNSGTYSTECISTEEANNQGTSHGPWCAGVLNSGGTLIIKGGTFSNDNFGDNSLATAARGLLLADTGAKIEINGGTFNALKNVIDIQNNLGDASKNPTAILSGGNFSSDPCTWEGLISVAEDYKATENEDGSWTVQPDYKDYVKKLNRAHSITSYISTTTGSDFLPIVALNPEITGYSVFDGDTRITDEVCFRISAVKKETIDENSYKVSFKLAIKDDKGEDLVLKPGMPSTINGKEYLHTYMNLIEVPAGYSVSEFKVAGTIFTETQNQSGNPATGEYWIGSDIKDIYFQSKTAGLIEVVLTK